MKKEKSTIFLMIWFIWAAGQDLDLIIRFSIKSDYYIYSSNGLAAVFFIFSFAVFLLNMSTVYYLFRPYYIGFYTGLSALSVAALYNIVSIVIALRDLPGVRHAYELGREVRGLPVRQEALDMIFSASGMYGMSVLMLLFYIIVAYFILKNKPYFFSRTLAV